MFAVLKTGGKQYKVAKDDVFAVEKLAAQEGDTVQFNEVLMIGGDEVKLGTPMIDGAGVQAEVVEQGKGPKVINYKKRRRKHSSQRKKGHRQHLTTIKITEILAKGADKSGVMAAIGAGSVAGFAVAAAVADEKPAKKKAATKKAAPKKADADADAKKAEADAKKAEAAAKKKADAAAKKKADDAAKKAAAAAPVEDGGSEPANLLKAAKGKADDLKRISGVGPKLEGTLNEIGVFHFWQIAEWGPAEIAFMDDRLSFKGRIERDNWIAQAKEFAAEDGK